MKLIKLLPTILGCLLLFACSEQTKKQEEQKKTVDELKIITAGGAITEVVYSLGKGKQIIATDRTSTYPAEMQQLPSIGYRNNITAEGLISLGADLIIAEDGYLSPEVSNQLTAAGVNIHLVKNEKSIAGTKQMITNIAKLFQLEEKGKLLIDKIDIELEQSELIRDQHSTQPKVLFIYARGHGTLNIGGKGTFAEEMVKLAGGQLAVTELDGFKPLTTEALVNANPDYLLFFDSGIKSLNGIDGVLEIPGVSQTNAGKNKNVITMDGLLLSGFDSRVGNAVLQLSQLIHPKDNS